MTTTVTSRVTTVPSGGATKRVTTEDLGSFNTQRVSAAPSSGITKRVVFPPIVAYVDSDTIRVDSATIRVDHQELH